jgi:Mrp family chromosome partitioning ATPase
MSRYFAVLNRPLPLDSPAGPDGSSEPQPAVRPNEYTGLIQRLFHSPSVVAVIGTGSGEGVTRICEEIGLELSLLGKRVVLVSVNALLHSSPLDLPDETAFIQGPMRNVWLWPAPVGSHLEFFKPRNPAALPENWLDSVRRNFDSVLLDCPAVETAPGGAAIGAMADAAVLAVQASRTSKHQILSDQRALQLSGVKLAGCIMIKTN